MSTDAYEQLTQALRLLPEILGTAAAIFVVVLMRQLTTWLTAWIALQNIHIAAQTGIARALAIDPTIGDTEAVKSGLTHVLDTMQDSLKKTGGQTSDLLPIVQSKIPEVRSR